jgi:hypothetical protein
VKEEDEEEDEEEEDEEESRRVRQNAGFGWVDAWGG